MRVAIVGGGATGVLAATHLARRFGAATADVVVIDPGESGSLGRGVAYATNDPRHLLNVRVANMSAFADQPDHLHAWLRKRGGEDCPTPFSFISRATYGDYIADLARETLRAGDDFFQKLGINSLQALDLLTRVENHFHVELPDYELQGVNDFHTLAERIQARL